MCLIFFRMLSKSVDRELASHGSTPHPPLPEKTGRGGEKRSDTLGGAVAFAEKCPNYAHPKNAPTVRKNAEQYWYLPKSNANGLDRASH